MAYLPEDSEETGFPTDAEEVETMMEDCGLKPSNTIEELINALNTLEDDDA